MTRLRQRFVALLTFRRIASKGYAYMVPWTDYNTSISLMQCRGWVRCRFACLEPIPALYSLETIRIYICIKATLVTSELTKWCALVHTSSNGWGLDTVSTSAKLTPAFLRCSFPPSSLLRELLLVLVTALFVQEPRSHTFTYGSSGRELKTLSKS